MQLNFKKFGEGFPVIILHGLLGSLDNWQTIAKRLAEHQPQLAVYIIDQRNHGRSPHSNEFDYSILAQDLKDFFAQHQIAKAHVIGHSMGGKTAMQLALSFPALVERLVVVDIAPVYYEDKHNLVFKSLFKADAANANTRQQVEDVLRNELQDETTVQFLMKGLVRSEEAANEHFQWRFALNELDTNYPKVAAAISGKNPFAGKTLFIKGQKSNYINPETFASVQSLFPDNELTEIKNAGHWVHAEQPQEFLAVLESFLTKL